MTTPNDTITITISVDAARRAMEEAALIPRLLSDMSLYSERSNGRAAFCETLVSALEAAMVAIEFTEGVVEKIEFAAIAHNMETRQ